MKSLKEQSPDEVYKGVLIGIPTFGMTSINFGISLATTGAPIFTSRSYLPVIGKPVDVARNEIAAVSISRNYSYVWFRDDDVSVEADSLVKLMARLTKNQKGSPRSVSEVVVGGVVYSKIRPPAPMIYRADVPGGYEDWNYGDLVECDAIGMGCTLIPVGVFNKIIEAGLDRYQCVNDGCAVNWSVEYRKPGNCPHCEITLAPMFFKTVRPGDGLDGRPVEMTEDTYFCLQAKDAGAKIYADCGVQCQHECTETGSVFYFHKGLGHPVWESEGNVEFTPQADTFVAKQKEYRPRNHKRNGSKKGKVKFNVGSGGVDKKGYINIDLYSKADFRCDVRDLAKAVRTYGQADEINASHVLEHVDRNAVPTTLKNWLKSLKPGGQLKIEVPDAKVAMEEFLYHDSNGSSLNQKTWSEAVVFGSQDRPGMVHQAAITVNKMNDLIRANKNMIASHSVRSLRPKGYNQQIIRATITKAG